MVCRAQEIVPAPEVHDDQRNLRCSHDYFKIQILISNMHEMQHSRKLASTEILRLYLFEITKNF